MAPRLYRLLVTWGNGQHGRLGHGGQASELFPRVVSALAGQQVAAASAGGAHTAVVTEDGGLWTFGINNHGQCGHSSESPHCLEPTEAVLPDAMKAVSAGESHTLALSVSGEVWAAGSNDDRQLGLGQGFGAKNPDFRLVQALKGTRIAAVAAGNQHSLALSDDGQVFAWGHGRYGQLGLGLGKLRWEAHPQLVEALRGVRVAAIAAGAFHSGAVDVDGNAWLWGHGGSWQLGLGPNAHECVPQQLPKPGHVRQLALGFSHSLSVGKHGDSYSWGTDEHGSLGQGFKWPKPGSRTPEQLPVHLAAGAAGWKHSAGIAADGRLYTWGWSGAVGSGGFISGTGGDLGGNQLGHGDDMDQYEPKQVQRLQYGRGRVADLRQSAGGVPWHALSVSCARNHTAAVVEAAIPPSALD